MFTKSAADITFSDVEEFCREFGEGVRVEYKQQIEHIPKIVSSFANTLGGIFIFGAETNEENKVIFPIQGIPKRSGFEGQILQSALTGIYPAVIPEVIIRDVPNTDNVVVIVRVDESVQAPHAIQNSTRVYIRIGSVTQPYELAEVDRIEYMLKRREDSQQVAQRIMRRIEARIESFWNTNLPDLTVIACPVFPYRPIISTGNIFEFACQNRLQWCYSSRVVGGFYASTERGRESYSYMELNEYGIVYRGRTLPKVKSELFDRDEETLICSNFVSTIHELVQIAHPFYEQCEYAGNIEITAHLRHALYEKLRLYQNERPDEMNWSADSEVLVSTQCLPRDLAKTDKCIDIVDELAGQLLWAFNVDNPTERRKLIERIL